MVSGKYGWPTSLPDQVNWTGDYSTSVEMIDSDLHTVIVLPVCSGEFQLQSYPFQPLCVQNGGYKLAKDDGQRVPVVAISIETAHSGETLTGQRIGKIINSSGEAWSWNPVSGEVWVSGEGTLVQGVSGENWQTRQARVGVVCNSTSIIVQL